MKKIIFFTTILIMSIGAWGQSIGSKNQLLEIKGVSQSDSTLIMKDGKNIQTGTTNGTIIGTATGEKIGFWGRTPQVRQSGDLVDAMTNIGLVTGSFIKEGSLAFTNITTANADITKHGLFPRLDNDSTHFINGLGNWKFPVIAGQGLGLIAGTGTLYLPDVAPAGTYEQLTITSYGIVTGGTTGMVQKTLSSAQILALNTTPVELVASPGSGKVIKVIGIIWDLTVVTTPYSSVVMSLNEGGNIYKYLTTLCLTDTVSDIFDVSLNTPSTGVAATTLNNSPMTEGALTLTAPSNPITGDGTAKITVMYRVITR
jgi:hypothetical protein